MRIPRPRQVALHALAFAAVFAAFVTLAKCARDAAFPNQFVSQLTLRERVHRAWEYLHASSR